MKDDTSLQRQLDRATEFARELSKGTISTEAYKARPFIKETYRANPCDNSSSDDDQIQSQKIDRKHFENGNQGDRSSTIPLR